jgi:uncharacterized protein
MPIMLSEFIDSGMLAELARQEAGRQIRLTDTDLVDGMSRLANAMSKRQESNGDPAVWVAVDLKFDNGPEGFPRLSLAIKGYLELDCQRCLRPVGHQFELESRLTVLDRESELDQVADPFDCITMDGGRLRIASVIEDEILSELPIAPAHPPEQGCSAVGKVATETNSEAGEMHRPFADLKSLIGDSGKSREN